MKVFTFSLSFSLLFLPDRGQNNEGRLAFRVQGLDNKWQISYIPELTKFYRAAPGRPHPSLGQ